MREGKGTMLFRMLVLYLVVRAMCAPIALRHQAAGSALGEGFVLRVCNWPAHKHVAVSMELCQALTDADHLALCGLLALLPLGLSLLPLSGLLGEASRSRRDAFRDRALGRLLC